MNLKQDINLLDIVDFKKVNSWHSFSSLLAWLFIICMLTIFCWGFGGAYRNFLLVQENEYFLKQMNSANKVEEKKIAYKIKDDKMRVKYDIDKLEQESKELYEKLDYISSIEYNRAKSISEIFLYISQSMNEGVRVNKISLLEKGNKIAFQGQATDINSMLLFKDMLQGYLETMDVFLEDMNLLKSGDLYHFKLNTEGFDDASEDDN